jgi:hypothetical protein
MQHTTVINPAYEELRAQLPECAQDNYDWMVEAGATVAQCEEAVRNYNAFWDDVPQEAKDGMERMDAAGAALEGLPNEEACRLCEEYLMVKRAGDFTEARHQRLVHEARLVRVRATSASSPTVRTRRDPRPRRRRSASTRAAGIRSGQDPGDEEPEPEPERRCLLCGVSTAHRGPTALYCKDSHGATYRKRRERDPNRDWNADTSYFQFDEPPYEQIRKRIKQGCRCDGNGNGHHIPDPDYPGHCLTCGHDRTEDLGGRSFVWARSAETRRVRKAVV